jgi:Caspase domain
MHRLALVLASLAMSICSIAPGFAQSRVALVIANSAYQDAPPLNTTIADATLVAATLQAAGYDVTGLTNVGKDNIGSVIGQFRDKLAAAGPNAIAFLYFAGYGAQLNGDDYLVPVDARIDSPDALNSQALPLSTIVGALAQAPCAARIIVLDAARDHGFGKKDGQPVPPGLALIGVPPGFLVAYSAAPNQVAPDGDGPDSPFAAALATLMRQPGLDIEQILKGVRLQVNQASTGSQIPWMTSSLNVEVKLFDAPPAPAASNSSPAPAAPQTLASALGVADVPVPPKKRHRVSKRMMQDMPADEAYRTAIEDDSLEDYQWFVEAHPDYSLAGQVWNIIDNFREGILWHRTLALGSTAAYWNYLDRYPDGPHAWEARDWLDSYGQPLPPPDYVAQPLDLPPGYYDEAVGLPDIVPDGSVTPADVFDNLAPIFVPPPPHWDRRPIVINVQPSPQLAPALPATTPVTPLPTTNQTPVSNDQAPTAPPNGNGQPVPPIIDPKKMTDQQLVNTLASNIAAYKAQQAQKNAALAQKFNLPPAKALTVQVIANTVD